MYPSHVGASFIELFLQHAGYLLCIIFRLLDFMVQTELTAIFEILNPKHQHVEDLSHLPTSELKFICWTSSELESCDDQKICNMPPHIGIEVVSSNKIIAIF